MTYRDVSLSTAAADLVRTAPGITAVHYEERVFVGSPLALSAPTARIKRGFLEAAATQGRLGFRTTRAGGRG